MDDCHRCYLFLSIEEIRLVSLCDIWPQLKLEVGQITCSTLYEQVLPNGLPKSTQDELDKGNSLKVAFWNSVEPPGVVATTTPT